MSMLEDFTGFDIVREFSVYDDANKNEFDRTFHEMPPTVDTFIDLAHKLGYHESEHIAMMRTYCIKTDYSNTENIPPAQGIATFERLCLETANQSRHTDDHIVTVRGLRLSEASVYFHFQEYSECIRQLRNVYDDVDHESYGETESTMEVAALIRHVAGMEMGQKAVDRTIEITA